MLGDVNPTRNEKKVLERVLAPDVFRRGNEVCKLDCSL